MPWHIEKRDNEYCVIKNDDGSTAGCHAAEVDAAAQVAALYASENKGLAIGQRATLEKQHTGVMVALFPDTADAIEMAIPGGEPVDELHLTLAYLGDSSALDGRDILTRIVEQLASEHGPITGTINGTGLFNGNDADVLWLNFDSSSLTVLRNDLAERLTAAGFGMGSDHGYTPHITLAYVPDLPGVPKLSTGRSLVFSGLTLAWAGERISFPFTSDKECSDCGAQRGRADGPTEAAPIVQIMEPDSLTAGQQKTLVARLAAMLKSLVSRPEPDATAATVAEPASRFMVWKAGDGRYRWLAIYSNKYRDRDNPPEILAGDAHKEFVAAVDAGEWPEPELWLWHTRGTRAGEALGLAYDDRGFALAVGAFDDGREAIAEALAAEDGLGVSHGMPLSEIRRDDVDKTVITRYRSVEISPLPLWAAANELTGFATYGGSTMAVTDEKRGWLARLLGEKGMADLDAKLDELSKEADGLDFKGNEGDAPEPAPEVKEALADVAPPGPAPDVVTRTEVADAVGAALADVTGAVQALAGLVGELSASVKALNADVVALKADDEAKIAKAAELTPAASLLDMIKARAVGSDEARIDGRSKLAKSGPAEKKPPTRDDIGIPLLDALRSGDGNWRAALGKEE